MSDLAVKARRWYHQWRHTVAQNLEQVARWGAKKIFLVGIKGTQVNYCTMHEWPAFLDRAWGSYATIHPNIATNDG